MKKNKKLIFFGVVLLVGIYFGCKAFYLYYYDIKRTTTEDFSEVTKGLKVSDTITIQTKRLSHDQYVIFDDMKIKNPSSDFQIAKNYSKDGFKTYALSSEGEHFKTAFMIGKIDTLVYQLQNDSTLYEVFNGKISNADAVKFLKKNHITKDIELFQFLSQVKEEKNHIFTSVAKMKERYLLHGIAFTTIPKVNSISLIDGDYTGYIWNANKLREVVILKNNKRYIYTFYNLDYFTDEMIKELLNTIEIQ